MRSSPEREIVLRVSEDGGLGAAINNAQFGHSGLVNFVKSANLYLQDNLLTYTCNPPIHYKFLLYPI